MVLIPTFSGSQLEEKHLPQVTLNVVLCIRQRRLSFLPPLMAFSKVLNPPFIIQPQQLQNCPGCLFCYGGEGFPKLC